MSEEQAPRSTSRFTPGFSIGLGVGVGLVVAIVAVVIIVAVVRGHHSAQPCPGGFAPVGQPLPQADYGYAETVYGNAMVQRCWPGSHGFSP